MSESPANLWPGRIGGGTMGSSKQFVKADPTRPLSHRPGIPHFVFIETRPAVAEALASVFEANHIGTTSVAVSSEDLLKDGRLDETDVVVLEIDKADEHTAEQARSLLSEAPHLALIALRRDEDVSHDRLRAMGFRGSVQKSASLQELSQTAMAVSKGELVFPRIKPASRRERANAEAQLLVGHLTPREREVLGMLIEGASSVEISRELGIKRPTVRSHIQSIMLKLQVHSRIQAVMFAVHNGLLFEEKHKTG